MRTSDFDYDLPPDLIAQEPPPEREAARLLVLDRRSGFVAHAFIRNLPQFLRAGDLLVMNDTRVIPARLLGQWADTGGAVELLLLEPAENGRDVARPYWLCLCGSGRRPRPGLRAAFAGGELVAEIRQAAGEGKVEVCFCSSRPLAQVLEDHGRTPVPPYIRRDAVDSRDRLDRARYQTVYAREPGAVAAPTAGLHFTSELLAALRRQGVEQAFVTLHVGPGTFKPVQAERLEDHRMEAERYEVPPATADALAVCRRRGGRVIAVGSTTVRTLETVAAEHAGIVTPASGRTVLFIRPPYAFRAVDAMLTNFHLPRSTLLAMVAAFAGREHVLAAYREAVTRQYRFFSYGDAMLAIGP